MFRFAFESGEREVAGRLRRINQQIKIALIGVCPMQN